MSNALSLSLPLLCLALAGCPLDQNRGFDSRFPATLTIEIASTQVLTLNSVYSTPAAPGDFVLKPQVLNEHEVASLRIARSTHEALLAGTFMIEGQCGDDATWTIAGAQATRRADDEHSIALVVDRCR